MAHLSREVPMTELCRQYQVSRKTGYKWVLRFLEGGMPALMDRSRVPDAHPAAIDEATIDAVLAMKKRYPSWGAKKLRARLQTIEPARVWPSESTFSRILKRHGLVEPRHQRRRTPVAEPHRAMAREPNDIWCADYKGKFRVGGRYCHPLTISDAKSRFVLCCTDTGGERTDATQAAFERTFQEYGLPFRIRSDNGTPFASTAIGGLSSLSIWWIKLGILPERTRPAHPQDNGMHERMHRTLKAETAKPPSKNLELQQKAFDTWRVQFNTERPHEALEMRTPSTIYSPSPRPMPDQVCDPDYPDHFEVRRVQKSGRLKFHGKTLHLSTILGSEVIGIEPVDDGVSQLWFGPIYLGLLTEQASAKLKLESNKPYQNNK
jgi:transposase InsO family protein